jgi:hypothetical protein
VKIAARISILVLSLLPAVPLVPPARAAPATGRLTGRVLDPEGRGVPWAVVVVEGDAGALAIARTAHTDDLGAFALEGLPPGRYRIEARAEGHATAPAARATIDESGEAALALTVGAFVAPPPTSSHRTSGGLLEGIPLPARSVEAAVRLGPGLRLRPAGAPGGALGRPEWRAEGFDVTDPRSGGLALPVGLDAVGTLAVTEGTADGTRAVGGGPLVELTLPPGSNRLEAGAVAIAGAERAGTTAATVRGALVRDRLWAVAHAGLDVDAGLEEGAPPEAGTAAAARGLVKATWQASPRHRLTLLSAAEGARGAPPRAFTGLGFEELLGDHVFLATRLAHVQGAGRSELRAGATAEAFVRGHDLLLRVDGATGADAGRRFGEARAALRESWAPVRALQLHAGVGAAWARPAAGRLAARGWSGSLAAIWDATHDGRTALRARIGSAPVPVRADARACAAPGEGGACDAARADEAAVGGEREILPGTSAGAELLGRTLRPAGGLRGDARELVAALFARARLPGFKASAQLARALAGGGPLDLVALVGAPLGPWLTLGALVRRAPEGEVAPAASPGAEERAPPPTTAGGRWLLGAQLRAELGRWVGAPAALWLDLIGPTPAPRPGVREGELTVDLRVGLRVEL